MGHVKGLAAGIGILAAATSLVWAQTPVPGRLYAFMSGLDWHIVAGQNGALSDNIEHMAEATGSVSGGNVQMTANEVGGQGRTAQINGTVSPSTG